SAIRSLPVGINSFAGGMSRDYGLQFAALVIGTIPMIVFYLIFHEYLEKGFAAGVSKE
ncbi:MAG: carbohydrate ABC transporter permease, partial [Sphaerochaetaceae bacterium]|nr:carbohydrate ABC transporter permease [Sphaerochaetaceae bacterium]